MSEYVTDEAVEKAARAEWDHDFPDSLWDDMADDVRDYYRVSARIALEAAAPLIAAKALGDRTDREYELVHAVDAELAKRGLGIDVLWGTSDDEFTVTCEITERASWADS